MNRVASWTLTAALLAGASPLLAQTPSANSAPEAKPSAPDKPAAPAAPVAPDKPAASAAPAAPATAAAAQPAADAEAADSPPNPHADPHAGLPSGHPSLGPTKPVNLVKGSPFASEQHRNQARAARAGQQFQRESAAQPAKMIPRGTIGVIVRDGQNQPLAQKKVDLKITRQSIAEGDKLSEQSVLSDAQGFAAFRNQRTETSFLYEVEVQDQGAKYTSGAFRLERDLGHIVSLFVYPTSKNIEDTMIISRGLYVIQPRAEVFQIEAILRIHNTDAVAWTPDGLAIPLPAGWKGFQPGETSGDLSIRQKDDVIYIDGTFSPGQHDFSFGFQLPNEQISTAQLVLPVPPHLVDARVFLEASKHMRLEVEGFEPAEPTRGTDGQNALLSSVDYLERSVNPPSQIAVTISGLPTKGLGTKIAFGLAAVIALGGLGLTLSRKGRSSPGVAKEDRERAKALLLEELVLLEQAYKREEIGPKTYEQTRRLLLDSLARLEAR